MSPKEPNDIAPVQTPDIPPMESVAVKTPLDYLMFVTWVSQVFFASLGGLVIGYCLFILPNDYLRCARFSFALDVLLLSTIYAVCPLVCSKRESGKSSNYWNREENAAVGVYGFWCMPLPPVDTGGYRHFAPIGAIGA